MRRKKGRESWPVAKGAAIAACTTDIPVYPHELVGISWYVSEKNDAAHARYAGTCRDMTGRNWRATVTEGLILFHDY